MAWRFDAGRFEPFCGRTSCSLLEISTAAGGIDEVHLAVKIGWHAERFHGDVLFGAAGGDAGCALLPPPQDDVAFVVFGVNAFLHGESSQKADLGTSNT